MKKILLIFVLFAPMNSVFAQSGGQPDFDPQNQLKQMEFIPPSPGTASLSNFNRPDANLSTGAAQFNLPVVNINAKDYTIPIALSYQSGGIKVDEVSSRVGMGWQLSAGGSISRVIMGAVDENSEYKQLPEDRGETSQPFINYLRNNYDNDAESTNDTQPDIFSYNFCGTSGQFYLNAANVPVQVRKSNLTIDTDFVGTAWNFRITDGSGNKFYFGGTYVEQSEKNASCSSDPTTDPHPTAWFLNKIELYSGENIMFSYTPISYTYDLGINQTMYAEQHFIGQCGECPDYSDDACVNYITTQTYYLNTITAKQKIVSFHYGTRLDYSDVLLNRIDVNADGKTESYHFDIHQQMTGNPLSNPFAEFPNSDKRYRPFLKSVTRQAGSETQTIYAFEYNNPAGLPVRLSYAQDHWGYFNGKNNASLTPKPAGSYHQQIFPLAVANREVDPVYSAFGMLTKIVYPTKGYDVITYESNTSYESYQVFPTATETISGTTTGTGTHGGPGPLSIGSFTTQVEQSLKITVLGYNATKGTSNPQEPFPELNFGSLNLYKNNVLFGSYPVTIPRLDALRPDEYIANVPAPPGSYSAEVIANGAVSRVKGTVLFIPGPITTHYRNLDTGGVRVKKISGYSYDNTLLEQKQYEYCSAAEPDRSSLSRRSSPSYMGSLTTPLYCSGPGMTCNTQECTSSVIFSSSLTNMSPLAGNHIGYRHVIEHKGSMDEGFTEHEYNIQQDFEGYPILGAPPLNAATSNNSSLFANQELKTGYYKKLGDAFKCIKRIRYKYEFTEYEDFEGVVINKKAAHCQFTGTGSPQPQDFEIFEATKYLTYSAFVYLDSVVEETYEDQPKPVINAKKYLWQNTTSKLPTEIISIDSRGRTVRNISKYPSDFADIPGTTSDLLNLSNDGVKTPVVYHEQLINNVKQSSFRSFYREEGSKYVPDKSVGYAADGTESKAIYFPEYDANGNITEQHTDDGVVHSYLWDAQGLRPTAEAVNAKLSDIAATSFEDNAKGGWAWGINAGSRTPDATAPTGDYSFYLQGPIQKTGLNTSLTYVLSYSVKNDVPVEISCPFTEKYISPGKDGWSHVRMKVSAITSLSIFIEGTGYIDELRLFTATAELKTFTYHPLHGVKSITDTNHQTTYFEYDAMGRLINVRDMDRHILTNHKYHYRE